MNEMESWNFPRLDPVSRLSQYGFGFQIIPKPDNQHGDQDGGGKQGDGPEDPRIEI